MGEAANERRARALAVAQSVLAEFGIPTRNPAILQDSNHTVILFAGSSLVAKVGTSPEDGRLDDEVRVARFLAQRGGPGVSPTDRFPAGPHLVDGLEVTFWEYCPQTSEEVSTLMHAKALRALHDAFDGYLEPLRPWDQFDGVGHVLENPVALLSLPAGDREFLRTTYVHLLTAIRSFQITPRPLHGEPHGGNLLLSPQGPRWIDFESACIGPQEWDLTMLPDDVNGQFFERVDWDLLAILRQMRSLCVATWCWLDPDRDPVLREAGTYHLRLLKALR